MIKKYFIASFVVLLLNLILVTAINDTSFLFSSPSTMYFNISINYAQINDFSFNITGSNYTSSFPSNITVDVADDSITDWVYKVFHSNISATAETVVSAWSNNPDSADIFFRSGLNKSISGTSLGDIQNNVFQQSGSVSNGTLGISNTLGTINKQIISITSNTSTVHAFLPALSGHLLSGFYVAQGGSTYYCNTDHTFVAAIECNLTITEAMIPTHLPKN